MQSVCSLNLCLFCEQKLSSWIPLYKLGSWNTKKQSNLTERVREQSVTRSLESSAGHTAGGYLSGQSPAHKTSPFQKTWPYIWGQIRKIKHRYKGQIPASFKQTPVSVRATEVKACNNFYGQYFLPSDLRHTKARLLKQLQLPCYI